MAILAGQKAVALVATPEALAVPTACNAVIVQAKPGNAGSTVFLGNATGQHFEVAKGESVPLDASNLGDVYVRVTVAGDGVNYLGVA